jgi:hypothetical protein
MARLRPVEVDKESPFIGEDCALCKQPFAPGDELAICPEDATRHHVHCWRAYGNKCTAYGCTGRGVVLTEEEVETEERRRTAESTTKTLPDRSFHCAQSCLLIAIAIAIIIFAVGCFGLWAIADFLMMEVFNLPYRAPLTGAIPAGFFNFLPILFNLI